MKKIFTLIVLLSSFNSFAQNLDSLSQLLNEAQNPEEKSKAYRIVADRFDNAGLSDSYALYTLVDKTKSPETKFQLYKLISDLYDNAGLRDSSDITNKKMLQIATELKNDTLIALAYNYIGGNFMNTGDYSRGLEYQFKSLATTEKTKGEASALTLKDIGVTYKYLKNFPEAIVYLKRAAEELPFVTRAALVSNRVYTHLAESFLGLGQIDSSLKYIQLANQFANKEDGYGYARCLYVFARIYEKKGDGDLAESFYKKCISLTDSPRISIPYVDATSGYSNYLMGIDQPLQAKRYALESLKASILSNNKSGTVTAAALLKQVYNKLNNRDSAYYYSEIKDAYRDSIFNEQQFHQVQNLSFAQQLKENEEQASLLEASHKRSQNLQYAAIAIGLISFVVLFFALSRTVIVKPRFIAFFTILGLLAVFEFINLFIHPYLANATNDSPVLMLIILIGIGALLIPVHHRLEKWITKRMVEKNKAIRLVAAKKTIEMLSGTKQENENA